MRFGSALKAMGSGRAVRRPCWRDDMEYLIWNAPGEFTIINRSGGDMITLEDVKNEIPGGREGNSLTFADLDADDWEIVE
jgi:hypothetical protein